MPPITKEPNFVPEMLSVEIRYAEGDETITDPLKLARAACPSCGGTGAIALFTSKSTCERCDGIGFYYLVSG